MCKHGLLRDGKYGNKNITAAHSSISSTNKKTQGLSKSQHFRFGVSHLSGPPMELNVITLRWN